MTCTCTYFWKNIKMLDSDSVSFDEIYNYISHKLSIHVLDMGNVLTFLPVGVSLCKPCIQILDRWYVWLSNDSNDTGNTGTTDDVGETGKLVSLSLGFIGVVSWYVFSINSLSEIIHFSHWSIYYTI